MAQWLGKIRSKGSNPPTHRKSWAQHWANSHSGQGKNFVFLLIEQLRQNMINNETYTLKSCVCVFDQSRTV